MTAERSYQFTSAAPPYGASYGETFIEQGGYRYDNPYIPTSVGSKELDEETGLYYYGARYYDPKISLWLSVDPKIENNKHQSPYVYTSANPIVLVDPDGKDDFYFDFEWGTYRIVRNNKPNRYFVAQYVFSKDDEEALARGEIVVGELEYKQVSLDDDLIHDRMLQGKHIFKWLLDHAGSEERYKEIYNSYHSVTETDKAKLIGVTLAVGFSPYAVEMLVSELSINSIVELYNVYSNFSTFKDIFTSFEKGDYKMTFALIGIAYSTYLIKESILWGIPQKNKKLRQALNVFFNTYQNIIYEILKEDKNNTGKEKEKTTNNNENSNQN